MLLADVGSTKIKYPNNYYSQLLKKPLPEKDMIQIEKDLTRTFPTHVHFREGKAQKTLYQVLHAFCNHNEKVGYCQGMVGLFLFYFILFFIIFYFILFYFIFYFILFYFFIFLYYFF